MFVVIGRAVVFWRKWVALRPKSHFHPLGEGGDILPAGPGPALKGQDSQTLLNDMYFATRK